MPITGISIDDFVNSTIEAYKKGFNDAIQCLIASEKTINEEIMKQSILAILKNKKEIKTDW